ncbi:hypothetical protein JXQ31_05380 [candidate division KSB1 bacterium]|nr:hypothetical protein [candidate division KSB1 bacterium]
MEIQISIEKEKINRTAKLFIPRSELSRVYLHIASAEILNRSNFYLRRHRYKDEASGPDPNKPCRLKNDSQKIPIARHIEIMQQQNLIPQISPDNTENGENFHSLPTMLAVPISDLVANLIRPSFHKDGLGNFRTFFFKDEPVSQRSYWCICYLNNKHDNSKKLEIRKLNFDGKNDTVSDCNNKTDLIESGLEWAAGIVPLVIDNKPLNAHEIAVHDYDLRQILGRDSTGDIQYIYEGWYNEWESRIQKVIADFTKQNKSFESFYHSILCLDSDKNVYIYQLEGALPELAQKLVQEGIQYAGLLDSGGSCAIYDAWLKCYLNHGWYYREPRGSILLFELDNSERIPLSDFYRNFQKQETNK